MKPLFLIPLLIACSIAACKQDPNSTDIEKAKQELELKRKELNDKRELQRIESEIKNVDSELKQIDGIVQQPQTVTAPAVPKVEKGLIVGTDVIMRQSASVQSTKIGNFVANEMVEILQNITNAEGETWYQVRRTDGSTAWVYGKYLARQ